MILKKCLIDPLPEIFIAAGYLNDAISAHVLGNKEEAAHLIRAANLPTIREWSESLWGKGGPWSRPLYVEHPLPFVFKSERVKARMPTHTEQKFLLKRDGFRCRFCGIPLVRAETRSAIHRAYPGALRWGRLNEEQHAAFQAMWLQFDHVVPHARGGTNDPNNIVVTCAPCNNGRANLTLEEAGLLDPRDRPPGKSDWDGLERFFGKA